MSQRPYQGNACFLRVSISSRRGDFLAECACPARKNVLSLRYLNSTKHQPFSIAVGGAVFVFWVFSILRIAPQGSVETVPTHALEKRAFRCPNGSRFVELVDTEL